MTAEQRRRAVTWLRSSRQVSARRARRVVGLSASSYRYTSRRTERDAAVRARLRALAEKRPRWGSPRLHYLLAREGRVVNHKRTERLYRAEHLAVPRRRGRRKHVSTPRVAPPAPTRPNERWSMDFVRDTFADGGAFRAFTLVDDYTRECPVIEVDRHLPSARVIEVLERLVCERGRPHAIVCDNGPEFTCRMFDAWAYRQRIQVLYIRPGKPIENAFIESFNGRLRDECLAASWFLDLGDARAQIEAWRIDYNTTRPHSGLAGRTPSAFAQEWTCATTSTDP